MSAEGQQRKPEFQRNRSITPNRSLFGSFGEAHRKITRGADEAPETTSTAPPMDEAFHSAARPFTTTPSPDEDACDHSNPGPASPVVFVPHGSPRHRNRLGTARAHLDASAISTNDPLAAHLHLLADDPIDDDALLLTAKKRHTCSSVLKPGVKLRQPPKLKYGRLRHHDDHKKHEKYPTRSSLPHPPRGEGTFRTQSIDGARTDMPDRPACAPPAGSAPSHAKDLALPSGVETSSTPLNPLPRSHDNSAVETEGNEHQGTSRPASAPTEHSTATVQKDDPFDPFAVFDTDSDHSISDAPQDPFEDDHKYSFLRPAAEKEVSRALRDATDLSHPSAGEIVYFEETCSPRPSIPSFDPVQFAERLREEKDRHRQIDKWEIKQGRRAECFYKTSAIQSAWKTPDNGIRIPTSPPPPSSDASSARAPEYELQSQPKRKNDKATPFFSTKLASATAGASGVTESGNDWVTVSDEQNVPAKASAGRPMGRVISGSSIANYSDNIYPPPNHQEIGHSSTRRNLDELDAAWWETLSYSHRGGRGELREATPQASRSGDTFPPDGFERSAVHGLGISQARAFFNGNTHNKVLNNGEEMELRPMPKRGERNKSKTAREPSKVSGSASPPSWTMGDPWSSPLADYMDDERLAAESDHLSKKYPSLPFPLLPLQEAARIQAHRRASGLEDQTESGSSVAYHPMTPRLRQNTSELPSPPTPSLNHGVICYTPSGSTLVPTPQSQQPLPRPRPTYIADGPHAVEVGYGENPFLSRSEQCLVAHSSRFDSGRSFDSTRHRLSSVSRPPLSTHPAIRRYRDDTDSELGAIASRYHYRGSRSVAALSDVARYRQTLFFILTFLVNIPLPFFGIAVLYGKLDSAMSWWTHGEAHGLAPHHLEWVRIQLVVEGTIYLMMTILLVVVYVQNQS